MPAQTMHLVCQNDQRWEASSMIIIATVRLECMIVVDDGGMKNSCTFLLSRKVPNGIISLILPMLEISVEHTVGKSFTANPNTFQHTIASQLMHDQMGVNKPYPRIKSSQSTMLNLFRVECCESLTWCFHFVWNNATDEMGRCGFQCCHQII